MRVPVIVTILLFQFIASAQSYAPKLVEEIKADQNTGISIPFKKYIFPNGLTLILNEDHTLPLVYTEVLYRVGNSRELPGQSGYAHFFEHLMFEGTKNISKKELYTICPDAYANINGHTHPDYTFYEDLVPKNYLEKILWMEADRMINLGNFITQEKLDLQRNIIINEKNQRSVNVPYGIANEKIDQVLYPAGHPYAWPVIGYVSDLKMATVEDMKSFFYKWYCPANTILSISGDLNSDEVVRWVTKYFAGIPGGKKAEPQQKFSAGTLLTKDVSTTYKDNVNLGLIKTAFPTVEAWNKDEAALDALSYILDQPDNRKRFIDTYIKGMYDVGFNTNIYHPCTALSGIFYIDIFTRKKQTDVELVNDAIKQTFKTFNKKGATEENLNEFIAFRKKKIYSVLESIDSKAERLAYYEFISGTPNMIRKDWDRYMNVTVEDVNEAFKKYLYGKPCVTLFVEPSEVKDKYVDISTNKGAKTNQATDAYQKQQMDTLSKIAIQPRPAVTKISEFIPNYWMSSLKNNLRVIGMQNNKTPVTSLQIHLKGGAANVYYRKAGVPYILASLFGHDVTNSAERGYHNNLLNGLGSSVNFGVSDDEFMITVECLNENFTKTMDLLASIVTDPKIDFATTKALKDMATEVSKQKMKSPQTAAISMFYNKIYPQTNTLHFPNFSEPQTISNIYSDDVKDFYDHTLSAKDAKVLVSSSIDKNIIISKLGFLEKWGNQITDQKFPEANIPPHSKIYFSDNPGAAQTEIVVGCKATFKDDTGDYIKLKLLNYIIGGSMNGRLNSSLREKFGASYGVTSSFIGTKYQDIFRCKTSVEPLLADSVLSSILQIIRDIHDNGITDDEYAMIQQQYLESSVLESFNSSDEFAILNDLIDADLNTDLLKKQNLILHKTTKEDINKLAQKYLMPDHLIISVVGNKDVVFSKLEKLNIAIVAADDPE